MSKVRDVFATLQAMKMLGFVEKKNFSKAIEYYDSLASAKHEKWDLLLLKAESHHQLGQQEPANRTHGHCVNRVIRSNLNVHEKSQILIYLHIQYGLEHPEIPKFFYENEASVKPDESKISRLVKMLAPVTGRA